MTLLYLIVLAAVAWLVWWLTGHDKNISGESQRNAYLSRAVRTLLVVFLMALLFGFPGPLTLLTLPICIALLMRSCISEIFAQGFFSFLDPAMHDRREIDLRETQRYQDAIAHLIHHDRQDDAIKLCEDLKKSGQVNPAALESTLEFLGVKQDRARWVRPVNEAARLRQQGEFIEAEKLLRSLLAKNPADTDAAMMLMRIQAQDLGQPGEAAEVLRALAEQPHVARAHLDFARRSIREWSQAGREKIPAPPSALPESVDEMLAQGFVGSAIARMEQKIKAEPGDFDAHLKLAHIYAGYCADLLRADKIIRRVVTNKSFSSGQVAAARAKLKEWQEAGLQRK